MGKKTVALVALLVCSLVCVFSFQALRVYAGTMESHVYTDNNSIPSGSPAAGLPMFSGPEASNLVPGDTIEGVLHVHNNRSEKVKIVSLAADDDMHKNDEQLTDNMQLTITGDQQLYQGSLKNFINDGIDLSESPISMAAESDRDLRYEVLFALKAGNDCQDKSCTVDFLVVFESDDSSGQPGQGNTGPGQSSTDDSENTAEPSEGDPGIDNTVMSPAGPSTAPQPSDSTVLSPVATLVEPVVEPAIQAVQEHLDKLPETGWAGMAGGSLAALFLAGTGLVLKQWGRRRGI